MQDREATRVGVVERECGDELVVGADDLGWERVGGLPRADRCTFEERSEVAAGALRVERTLHEGFFREFDLTPADVLATPLAPTTLAYTHYLLAVAYGKPFHEALAALLPCYWIYWEVGKELLRRG